jgi:hypothetical protein
MKNSSEGWNFGTKLKIAASAFVVMGTMLATQSTSHAEGKQPIAVVEMFTSQGCSSCPPADKVVSDYAKKNNVLALSIHVDYWNYLGWKDTFSKAEFSQRQQLYAISFARRGVYTPQAVVNGRTHVVGSNGSEITKLVDQYKSSNKGLYVPIKTSLSGDSVNIKTGADAGNATLHIVYFDKEKRVKIKRGENAGKTISYHNVVRDIVTLGMMKQGKLDITVPLSEIQSYGTDAYVIILQKTAKTGTPGAIIGATVMESQNNS